MKRLDNLRELEGFLTEDRKRWSQWIVRFIHTENESDWMAVARLLQDFAETRCLSRYCRSEDVFPNLGDLLKDLEALEKSALLLPLPAHLRMVSPETGSSFLGELLRITPSCDPELRGKLRIYVPLYGLEDQLRSLIQVDRRLEDTCTFLANQQNSKSSRIMVINHELRAHTGLLKKHPTLEIRGYKEYLEYWEGFPNPGEFILLYTRLAESDAHPFSEHLTVLATPFAVLREACTDWSRHEIEEGWGSEEYWRELLKRCTSSRLMENLAKILEIAESDRPERLLERWPESNRFERWLTVFWLFLRQPEGYLKQVFQKNFLPPEEFESHLVDAIFSVSNPEKEPCYWEIYRERQRYLQAMQIRTLPESFWQQLEKQHTPSIYYLTKSTKEEKAKIVEIVGSTWKASRSLEQILGPLQRVYPELYWYLAWDMPVVTETPADLDVKAYFQEYVFQKVANFVKPEFVEKVCEIAREKGLWWQNFASVSDILKKYHQKTSTLLYWIDGLGLEYLGYLQHWLSSKKDQFSYALQIGYVNLPTTTQENRIPAQGNRVVEFRKLDEWKHSYRYKYPESIVEELELLQEALEEMVEQLRNYQKVVLVSDHGTSRLAVLYPTSTTHQAKKEARVEKYGRYCVDQKHAYGSEIPVCIDMGEYHIIADYSRFSGSGGSTGEVHGGATLEEVLVPIIEIRRVTEPKQFVSRKIRLETSRIELKPGVKPKIRFEISPEIESEEEVTVQVGEKMYPCMREGSFWVLEIETKASRILGTVFLGSQEIGTIDVPIKRGIAERNDI